MKTAVVIALIIGALVAVLGPPIAASRPVRDAYWFAPKNILPMTFAHADHKEEACVTCHHNFTDGLGFGNCMTCHVSDKEVWPVLETQFHTLCRSCHEERDAEGKASGPVRACVACHLVDDKP